MSDIFREVDEALKREKTEEWWKENGKAVILGCIVAIVATAVTSFGIRWMEKNRVNETTILIQTLKQNNVQPLLDVAQSAPKGIATLARFHAAQAAFTQGKDEEGFAILHDLSQGKGVDSVYSDYATLLYVLKKMNTKDADAKALLEMIEPVASKKNTWRFSALEAQALLYYQTGEKDKAIESIEKITNDKDVPPSIMVRAQKIAHVIKNINQ